MAHLVVGDPECDFNTLVLTIRHTRVPLHDDLWNIAAELGISEVDKEDLRRRMRNQDLGIEWGMGQILQKWRNAKVRHATLDILISAFERNNLNVIAGALRERFNINETNENNSTLREENRTVPVVEQVEDTVDEPVSSNTQQLQDGSCLGLPCPESRPEFPILWQVAPENLIKVSVTPPLLGMNFTDDHYKLSVNGKRRALIINIIQFKNEDLNRDGAIYDSYNLSSLFSNLNYSIDYKGDHDENFTKERIAKIVKDFKKKCITEKVETFIVFIGSHGEHSNIHLSNGEKVNLYDDIIFKLTDPPSQETGFREQWTRMPKVFIVSACRDRPRDSVRRVDNTIVCYSCLPHQASRRDPNGGTDYIKCFTEIMMQESSKRDFETILTMVEEKVWRDFGRQQPNFEKLGGFQKLYFNMAPAP